MEKEFVCSFNFKSSAVDASETSKTEGSSPSVGVRRSLPWIAVTDSKFCYYHDCSVREVDGRLLRYPVRCLPDGRFEHQPRCENFLKAQSEAIQSEQNCQVKGDVNEGVVLDIPCV